MYQVQQEFLIFDCLIAFYDQMFQEYKLLFHLDIHSYIFLYFTQVSYLKADQNSLYRMA